MNDTDITLIVFREALRYKAILHKEIVSWADSIISTVNSPQDYIVDLSLSVDNNDAISIISEQCRHLGFSELSKHPEMNTICKRIFKYLLISYQEKRLPAEVISKIIYDMALDNIEPSKGISNDMLFYWDGLDLAKDGIYGDYDDIQNEMIKLLTEYGV